MNFYLPSSIKLNITSENNNLSDLILYIEPLRNFLEILQKVPGYSIDIFLKKVPRLVNEPYTKEMGMKIAKKLTETDGNISITFWQSAGVIPITFIAAIFVWDGINGKQLFLVSLITIVATIAQFSLNYALKRGEISFLLPLDYLRLIWAVWLGYIMFSEIPLNNIWIGGTIIVASTTYIGIRENYLNRNKI